MIIPTYNRAAQVERAVRSVLAQSYGEFEILVMDDGSTDGTGERIAAIGDPRIIYQWEENWGGPARPRNRGLRQARGEWVCFLDADDWWSADKLETCAEQADDDVDMLYHDLVIFRERPALLGRRTIRARQLQPPMLVDLLLNGNSIPNSSVLVRRAVLQVIGAISEDREMIACEDYHTWLRVVQRTERVRYVPLILGFYSEHDGSISRRDMSLPTRRAVAAFTHVLNETQTRRLEALLRYSRGRHQFAAGLRKQAARDFAYCIRNSDMLGRAKAALRMLRCM